MQYRQTGLCKVKIAGWGGGGGGMSVVLPVDCLGSTGVLTVEVPAIPWGWGRLGFIKYRY